MTAVVPYLVVPDTRAAVAWYRDALHAEEVGEPWVMDDGRVGHAELRVGGGTLYLADPFPEMGVVAPWGSEWPVSLVVEVDDVEATLARVEASGGRRDRDPDVVDGVLSVWVVDPFGHRWHLTAAVVGADPRTLEEQGWRALSTDGATATAFYDEVLADAPLFLLPGGLRLDDRARILGSMGGPPWSAHELSDVRVLPLGDDGAVVTYGVVARRDGSDEYSALVTSTYARVDGAWRLVVHQQTPR
ncbi:DUF4440 domain-containing protein [Oerskovia flava]|uniref:DUF4440 domain-containing protein n=1 Tax=Oerskovia flava TaxID=2986422 RepID=UPI00223F565A|nr:DUF4440 domain-containing protein [Oerskovia sp. JB1-3-2]